jgi:rhodanese-related sulfurtransferase
MSEHSSEQFSSQPLPQVTVEELAQKLAESRDAYQLVDVREPWEVETAGLEGFINLPLSEYAEWSGEIHTQLDADKETFVMCHHGIRSAQMCQWLMMQGFTNVKNIAGGIAAYARFVDPTVPQY